MLITLIAACYSNPTDQTGVVQPDKEHQQDDTAVDDDTAFGDDTSYTDDTGDPDDTGPSDDTGDPDNPSTWYRDADGDGYGDALDVVEAAEAPDGYASDGTDCDDASDAVHPGAVETCDGIDEDCSGRADDMGPGEHCLLDGVLDLADAGQRYTGSEEWQEFGQYLTCGGDTNSDGKPELFVNDFMYGAWLVVDPVDGTSPIADAAFLVEPAGEIVPGDLNDDGYGDIIGGGMYTACLVSGPVDGDRSMSDCDATLTHDHAIGMSGGTLLGDELVAIGGAGTWYDSALGLWGEDVGAAFVFEGPLSGDITTDEAVATITPHIQHEGGRFAERMCSGDLDGDGYLDLAATATPLTVTMSFLQSGLVYVMDGPVEGDIQVAEGDGTLAEADARINGNSDSRWLGSGLSCGGDVNGDGLDDVLVGAPLGDDAGAVLYYGPVEGEYEVADADARVSTDEDSTYLGRGVTLDADLDGDGLKDIAVTDYLMRDGNLYLFYDALSGITSVEAADAMVIPETDDYKAYAVAGCPDMDDDGIDELLVGAEGYDSYKGAAYLVYGGDD